MGVTDGRPREARERTYRLEHCGNVLARLCARLEEQQVLLVGVPLRIFRLDCPPLRQVRLVADKSDNDGGVRLALEFPDPGLCLLERCLREQSED